MSTRSRRENPRNARRSEGPRSHWNAQSQGVHIQLGELDAPTDICTKQLFDNGGQHI
jgi:hypothetical protein